ncbi:MAG: DNA methyltransferase [Actinomycetota bacterium]
MTSKRRPTSTSAFGVSRRESHDATAFYDRFAAPDISSDDTVERNRAAVLDRIYQGDSRHMTELADASVALVVTSPPYFAGKAYEQAMGEGHVPGTYLDYLELLTEVFAECVRKLEPGGRLAVNVANLGRRPFRSLAADVTDILQNRLRLLLRGEIIWVKSQGANGSCAWGSFQSPANPVLRDLTERVIVASKGRFDRALSRRERARRDPPLPSEVTIFRDDFMEATTDVWELLPESAQRVGHPAPFPVELPERLIHLYTYKDDVVVDPFIGSGSTAVAAVRTQRHFVGYDTDPGYVDAARKRVEDEQRLARAGKGDITRVSIPVTPAAAPDNEPYQSRAVREGQRAKEIAKAVLKDCGFDKFKENLRLPGGVEVNFSAIDKKGRRWFFDVSGAFTSTRAGLRRTDTLWKALGKASVLHASRDDDYRLVFLTTDLPPKGSAGGQALRAAHGVTFHDAIAMLLPESQERLRRYADGEDPTGELLLPGNDHQ